MLSKTNIKHINSLAQKKFRDEHHQFLAEGSKLVLDLLPFFRCTQLVVTAEWLAKNTVDSKHPMLVVEPAELSKISNQKSPQGVLAVFEKPSPTWTVGALSAELSLVLDDVQDPGNLGTIVRIADWFGITHVFCSFATADAYSPKAVQATMGALARVQIHYLNLTDFLAQCQGVMPIYGTFMNGENIYANKLTTNGLIVMGNEGNGVSSAVEAFVSKRLLIPNYPAGTATSESLNVGVATALVCAEFRRRLI